MARTSKPAAMGARVLLTALVACCAASLAIACRGEAPHALASADIQQLVDSLRPAVEMAAAMKFRSAPRAEMRSREQVRAYLAAKLDADLPEAKARGIEATYRLFGLLADTVRVRPLLLELLSEQVVGYYDPDSVMLFGVAGSPRDQLRLVLAHEMVHALQGQYLPLDSIFHDLRSNDRLSAAQAILEGQATYASIRVLAPGNDITRSEEFWSLYRDQVQAQQASMPVFARAPLIVREGLIFPYIGGAEFMHWWEASSGHADTLPYGPRMPASTEQVLHPDRYARGDAPLRIVTDSVAGTIYQDVLGELEARVLVATLTGAARPDEMAAMGWGGDRYRVIDTPGGPALIWFLAFDDPAARDRFVRMAGVKLGTTARAGYRALFEPIDLGGHPAIRYVLAPGAWDRWNTLPAAHIAT
ncbi:MAG: hypothetical protein H0U85_00280 [Gemmatimonadales bacterium]|nr:hypothetical protein [Gemmatimonadales bacterium]